MHEFVTTVDEMGTPHRPTKVNRFLLPVCYIDKSNTVRRIYTMMRVELSAVDMIGYEFAND